MAGLLWACGAGPGPAPAVARPLAGQRSAKPPSAPRVFRAIGSSNVGRVAKAWEVAAGGRGRAVAVSRAASRVAFSSGSPIRLYELRSGKPAGTINTCEDVIRGGLGYHGQQLVVVCESGVRIYEGTKASQQRPVVHASRITASSLVWPWLALGHHDGVIRIYGLDGSATIEIPVPGPPIDVKSLALTEDGSRLAVAWVQGSIWWWETARPDVPHRLVRHENESDTVAFNADGTRLAEEGKDHFTTVWSFGSTPPVPVAELKNGDWIKRLLFTRDSAWLIRGGSDGLELAEVDGPRRVALDSRGAVEDVALDQHGSVIAAADRDGRLALWTAK